MNTNNNANCASSGTLLSRRSFLITAVTLGATVAAVYLGVIKLTDLTSTSLPADPDKKRLAKYRYDQEGRLVSVTYPDGANIEYHYDQGRVSQVVHRVAENGRVIRLRNIA